MENKQVNKHAITQTAIEGAKAVVQAINNVAGPIHNSEAIPTANTSSKASGQILKQPMFN